MREVYESENFYFETIEELTYFLKEEWSYEDRDVDLLLEEKFEEDEYCDAHEKTTSKIRLMAADAGGFTLSAERAVIEYDNYS
tara:strand:- start:2595 stop:2843 length:249 start_codon:yes stop_codon:yes gene_type:complete